MLQANIYLSSDQIRSIDQSYNNKISSRPHTDTLSNNLSSDMQNDIGYKNINTTPK